MKKVQKNSFEKMCDRLEENFVLNENEIKYVKKHLYPIKEDKDMLLKLKAEALEDDYIAVMSLMVAVITLCVTMLSEIGMPARWVLFLIYSVLLVYYFVTIKNKMRYFKNVNKWRQYILVCIDEMVNEQNKKKKKRHK